MPKHTWAITVKGDNGTGPTIQVPIYFTNEQNIGGSLAGQTGLQVGPTDVEEVDGLSINVSQIESFYMKADCDIQVRTNSWVSPAQTFDIDAKNGLSWNNQGFPVNVACPLTVNITKLFIFNKNTVNGVAPTTPKTATFIAGFGMEPESVFS